MACYCLYLWRLSFGIQLLDVICFFFKQKTAYEMRISDWSSDVCSSDLLAVVGADDGGIELELLRRIGDPTFAEAFPSERRDGALSEHRPHRHLKGAGVAAGNDADEIGRAHV